jgi:hypothetical protein
MSHFPLVKHRLPSTLVRLSAPAALVVALGFAGCGAKPRAGTADAGVDRSVADAPADLPRAATGGDSGASGGAAGARGAGGATTPQDSGARDAPVDSPPVQRTPFAVVTNRYDNVRNGANLSETILNVANVGGGQFGLLFSRVVDGHVYAQPLYLPGLDIGGATHNVVFVATEHDTVFAFDADNAAATAPLWSASLGTPMDTTPGVENQPIVPPATVSCRDMFPKTGITSTPVIDPATGRMYVVTKNFEGGKYYQRLHALDVLTGKEAAGSPVDIAGSVPGTSPDGNGTTVSFDPYHHLNRPGLLLTGGNVYIAFASHCDDEPYHGWIFAYAASTLAQTGIFCTTPNGGTSTTGVRNSGQGGIWQSGMGLVADQNGIYFVAGNGAFDSTNSGTQLGVSVARLQLMPTGFKLMDWFTAYNAQAINVQDLDYTTAAVMLPEPKVIVMGGKDGYLNVIDPANMGHFNATANQIIQQAPVGGHTHGGPVYWKGPAGPTIYIWSESTLLRSFGFTGNKFNTAPTSQYAGFRPAHPGGILSLSANGAAAGTGIIWATTVTATAAPANDAWHQLVPGTLRAFDATNLTTPLWTSPTTGADALANLAKFNAPVVANGKVYVVSQGSPDGGNLHVFGLRP